ncbi:MAG: helix-turn-helix domain-containing protein [Lachnospiraceae bacterium]|nr:helix-turn-helix domain-containing protein [Lachnospiraceae bacterium]MBO4776195.1 helix-turn-helix domain-containing protein [Lachnospiraceae bacterium]
MGKKSVKENKNIYQLAREAAGLTRSQASEALVFISDSRIEKIESEKCEPHPDEILAMAKAYKKPSLCNYYCSNECPIGQVSVPELKDKDLAQITLEMLSTINILTKQKDRLVEITVDGKVSKDEMKDFLSIKSELDKMTVSIESLKLWINQMVAEGKWAD